MLDTAPSVTLYFLLPDRYTLEGNTCRAYSFKYPGMNTSVQPLGWGHSMTPGAPDTAHTCLTALTVVRCSIQRDRTRATVRTPADRQRIGRGRRRGMRWKLLEYLIVGFIVSLPFLVIIILLILAE